MGSLEVTRIDLANIIEVAQSSRSSILVMQLCWLLLQQCMNHSILSKHCSCIALHCIRAPPRRGMDWEIHPRRPKDFPRPERFHEGEARGKSQGSREIWRAEGMDFPIPPEFWWSTDNLSASFFLQGVDQKILPRGQGRIDSVKINPSLLMMRDCVVQCRILCSEHCVHCTAVAFYTAFRIV